MLRSYIPMVKTRARVSLAVASISTSPEPSAERPRKRIRVGSVEKQSTASKKTNTFLERVSSPWKVGAHVSAAGGVENAVTNAAAIGANAFALFLKSQRKWISPPLSPQSITEFKMRMSEFGYTSDFVLPHGSYLINLGNPDEEKREKSYTCFIDDLKRCEELGLTRYNFHPGSTVGETTITNSISLIAQCVNRAHKETKHVVVVLENMAGAGNVIGSDFAHLKDIIAQVEDKTRVGVCLDTCHAFAAGYDIRTKEGWDATMADFDSQIGLSYLRGMHLNDSKTQYNSKKDRHENIGLGTLGISTFKHILRDPRVQNIPLILETASFECPAEVWGKEIEVLYSLSENGGHDELLDDNLVKIVKDAVRAADGKKTKKKKEKGTGKRKAKKKSEDSEEESS